MRSTQLLLVAATALGVSTMAHAAPITYTMVVDGVNGLANGVAVGPGATTTIVINADTSSVTANTVGGQPGHCVQGTSGTIAITGLNGGATQALTGTYFVCGNDVGDNVGVYPAVSSSSPIHGGNSNPGTGALTGAPVVDLISNIGPVSYIVNTIHSHGGSGGTLQLQAGGTYEPDQPEAGGNTTASTFTAQLNAAPVQVPTLQEWARIAMAGLLVAVGVFFVRRRQG